jgi:Zn-dependent metalloprotease
MSRAPMAAMTAGVAMALALAGLATTADASSTKSPAAAKPQSTARHHDSTPDKTFTPATRAAALAAAKTREPAISKAFGLSGAQKLHVKDVERDADGTLHLRYNRTLGGLKVFGGDVVVHVAPGGKIRGADFASSNPLALRVHTPTKVSGIQAAKITAGLVHAHDAKIGPAKKVVWAVDGIPRLAWYNRVVGHDKYGNPIPRAVVVDARTGRVIQSWDLLETDAGTGHSLYVGDVAINTTPIAGPAFQMQDPTHGNGKTFDVNDGDESPHDGVPPLAPMDIFTDADNVWGSGTTGDRASAAVDVVYGTGETWDYYEQTFGRTGVANDGKSSRSRVHYGVNFGNAFWSDACFCMTYGDGSGASGLKTVVGLDVIGHEMSHGVTSRTSGLWYFGDAGGLNESTSDIFGTAVEFFANNAIDVGDYLIGENVMISDPYLRRMDDPHADGVSINCWSGHTGLADPHFSSGVGNHFFYMLAEGSGAKTINAVSYNAPLCGGAPSVAGIGRNKASRIWYRALTRYFVSTTNYIDARDATIHAAVDLFGKGSPQCAQVVRAWNAVAVPKQYWTCNGGLKFGKSTFGKSPGFEKDRGVWSAGGVAGITNIRNPNFAIVPHTGHWFAGMNGNGTVSNASISRKINVPDSPTATLRFYMEMSVAALDGTGSAFDSGGSVKVFLNGKRVATFTQAYANNSYIRWDVDVHKFRGKKGVNLVIKGHENAPAFPGTGYFFALLDDFTVTPR